MALRRSGGRVRRGRAGRRRHRGAQGTEGRRRGEGAAFRRDDGRIRRLGLGSLQRAGPQGRRGRHGRAARVGTCRGRWARTSVRRTWRPIFAGHRRPWPSSSGRASSSFELGPLYADYHPEAEGGLAGGRALVARPYDGRALGREIARLKPPAPELTFLGMMVGSGKELKHFFNLTRSVVSAGYVGLLLARFLRDRLVHGRAMRLTNGNALVARLASTAFALGVEIRTSSPAVRLLGGARGVRGAVVGTDGGEEGDPGPARRDPGGRRVRARSARCRHGCIRMSAPAAATSPRWRARSRATPSGWSATSVARSSRTTQRGRLGAAFARPAQGRQPRPVPAFHRPRQAGRDRRHARRGSASSTRPSATTISFRP